MTYPVMGPEESELKISILSVLLRLYDVINFSSQVIFFLFFCFNFTSIRYHIYPKTKEKENLVLR